MHEIQLYHQQISALVKTGNPEGEQRRRQLIETAAKGLKHFFEKGIYGDPQSCDVSELPVYWSYVRFLTWDQLRPQLGHGETEYSNQNWRDKFLTDLSDEAVEVAKIMPEDLKPDEWHFIVHVCATMLMSDPFLINSGYTTEGGRQKMVTHALMTGPSDDMYHHRFTQWKEELSSGPKVEEK